MFILLKTVGNENFSYVYCYSFSFSVAFAYFLFRSFFFLLLIYRSFFNTLDVNNIYHFNCYIYCKYFLHRIALLPSHSDWFRNGLMAQAGQSKVSLVYYWS